MEYIDFQINNYNEIKIPILIYLNNNNIINGYFINPLLLMNLINWLSPKYYIRLSNFNNLLNINKIEINNLSLIENDIEMNEILSHQTFKSNNIENVQSNNTLDISERHNNIDNWKKTLYNIYENIIFNHKLLNSILIDAYIKIDDIIYLLLYDKQDNTNYNIFKELVKYKNIIKHFSTEDNENIFFIIRLSDTFTYYKDHIIDLLEYSKQIITTKNIIYVQYKNPLNINRIIEDYTIYFFNYY
jgi:hypothetical protein